MEHIIAYNPYKNGNKGSVSSQPLSVYDKTIAYPWMADLVAAIRGHRLESPDATFAQEISDGKTDELRRMS